VGGTDWDTEAGTSVSAESRSPWVLFVWEVQAGDGANRLHMGLFNLDLVSVTGGLAPLAYPFQKEKACLAMWVDPTSISDFFACTSGLFSEERQRLQTYAASAHTLPVSFDVSCLYVDTYTHCSWLGDQEKVRIVPCVRVFVLRQGAVPFSDASVLCRWWCCLFVHTHCRR
jgi:hypothetical protein